MPLALGGDSGTTPLLSRVSAVAESATWAPSTTTAVDGTRAIRSRRQSHAVTPAAAMQGRPVKTKLAGTLIAAATLLVARLPMGVLPMKIVV